MSCVEWRRDAYTGGYIGDSWFTGFDRKWLQNKINMKDSCFMDPTLSQARYSIQVEAKRCFSCRRSWSSSVCTHRSLIMNHCSVPHFQFWAFVSKFNTQPSPALQLMKIYSSPISFPLSNQHFLQLQRIRKGKPFKRSWCVFDSRFLAGFLVDPTALCWGSDLKHKVEENLTTECDVSSPCPLSLSADEYRVFLEQREEKLKADAAAAAAAAAEGKKK